MNVQDGPLFNSVPIKKGQANVDQRLMKRSSSTSSSGNNNNSPQKQDWWKKSVVRRSMSSIEPDLDDVISKSPFLQRHGNDDLCDKQIAVFHRGEIEIGELIGRGGFSNVYEITAFYLNPDITVQCTPDEQRLRQYYADTVFDDVTMQNRYCIKHLQERLTQSPKDFQCAATDLAVETAFMSALEHQNVLSVRGLPIDGLNAWSSGSHDGYFLITDRLDNTLDRMIQEWKQFPETAPTLEDKSKLAMQLADALRYLHSNRVIFRDLKPHNIGITASGEVKLFDFGLCRELPDVDTRDGVYEMSGVGTRRYMAVEIINTGRYNLKADVFGWSMVFWEMLSHTKPFAPYSTEDHRRNVCKGGERPTLQVQWPYWIHNILQRSWDESIDYRLTMQEVYMLLHRQLVPVEKEHKKITAFDIHNEPMAPKKRSVLRKKSFEDFVQMNSPTGINDFDGGADTRSLGFSSVEMAQSIDQLPLECWEQSSPPPAPKKPAVFLNLPDLVIKNIALARDLAESDDDVSLYSLDDDSFADHVQNEVWG